MKMAKKQSTISLQQVTDFCLDIGDSDLDSSTGGLSSGEKDEIDKEMLQEGKSMRDGKVG